MQQGVFAEFFFVLLACFSPSSVQRDIPMPKQCARVLPFTALLFCVVDVECLVIRQTSQTVQVRFPKCRKGAKELGLASFVVMPPRHEARMAYKRARAAKRPCE